jgi:site-specific DNA-methyltransferase (adenine-specific)/modification methylase
MMTFKDEWTSDCGTVRLICGDCLEVLPTLGKVDAVVTDPPYGIGVDKMTLGNGQRIVYRGEHDWDCKSPDLDAVINNANNCIVWGGNFFALPKGNRWLVWDKGTGTNDFADCELAWTNLDGAIRKLFLSWVGANAKEKHDSDRFHPTQKPVRLMEWCLSFLPDSESILDPFMGSGTTGVACVRTGRKFIGIEREPKYFEIAKRRISEELNRFPLLEKVESPQQMTLQGGDDEPA